MSLRVVQVSSNEFRVAKTCQATTPLLSFCTSQLETRHSQRLLVFSVDVAQIPFRKQRIPHPPL